METILNNGRNYEEHLESRYAAVTDALSESDPGFDRTRLRAAFEFMCRAHAGQLRKSGEPYAIHPVEVALIVAGMNLDSDSVIAALLHDVIEDTDYEYPNVKERFGYDVANLVDGVTKLTRVNYSSKEEQQMENLRKMFLAMARDIRVIMIKIADRLHNMRTLEYHNEKKRREKSLETMEIYAPLAYRLGMQLIKWELEDLALKNLDPIAYDEITLALVEKQRQNNFLRQAQESITERMETAGIHAKIEGRVKHIYSIYRKMYNQHKALFEIYDLYAVRVIVDTLADCYNVLGFVHDTFKPIPGRFKDYISTPKPNMYQSLHTTVIGREGMPFEVQIRTWDMHRTAEYGIAAHWQYKDGVPSDIKLSQRLEWVRRLLETQQETDAEDFVRTIKLDMFADEVFVFTPRGDVINLPNGANTIDFAYAIHSAVGNRMMGAKVGGRLVPLDYLLENGDIIEIITGNTHGPSRDWLKIVKTNEARNKIKQWFKKERREENISQGKSDFERELRRAGIPLASVMQDEILSVVLRRMSFAAADDMYSAIGYGGLTTTRAINRFRDELVRVAKQADVVRPESLTEKLLQKERHSKRSISGVIVDEMDNCLLKFSRCCMPVPGDPIVGFVTRGYGVSIHRADCNNLEGMKKSDDAGRWLTVRWADEALEQYKTDLLIIAHGREDLLMDIISALTATHFPILSISAKKQTDGIARVELTAEVSSLEQIDILRSKLARISGVMSVTRM